VSEGEILKDLVEKFRDDNISTGEMRKLHKILNVGMSSRFRKNWLYEKEDVRQDWWIGAIKAMRSHRKYNSKLRKWTGIDLSRVDQIGSYIWSYATWYAKRYLGNQYKTILRKICPDCGGIYSMSMSSRVGKICPDCGALLEHDQFNTIYGDVNEVCGNKGVDDDTKSINERIKWDMFVGDLSEEENPDLQPIMQEIIHMSNDGISPSCYLDE
jgi:hypothetical protein